jgi:DNA-binding IclR family transcriptional regulator
MPRTNAEAGVTVTSRALSILGSFDAEHRSLTLSEIARRADLTLPTAHRLAGELAAWGALRRTSHGRYVIGRRLWDLGLLAPVQTGLRDVASPFLQDLYGATLATVHLAVRDGTAALYLERVSGHASVPVVSRAGGRLPLHSTGVGKVLLAYSPATVRHKVLAAPLDRFTPYTVTRPDHLASQLRCVPQDGYATTTEEMTLGACSIAVPVSVAGHTVASLGIVVPDLRSRKRLLPAVQVAAQGIARSLRLSLLSFNGSHGWRNRSRRPIRRPMRTDVAIIGAGPAGLLLSHLLAQDGIESVVIEARTKDYVSARIRAGILESSSVDLLRSVGLGAGIEASGDEHRGIYLQWPHERHHLDFVSLTGRSVWVYGQTQLQADLHAATGTAGRPVYYAATDVALHDLDTDRPHVTFTDDAGTPRRIDALAIAGCDGSFGPSRAAIPDSRRDTWERVYPYSWLGILAESNSAFSRTGADLRLPHSVTPGAGPAQRPRPTIWVLCDMPGLAGMPGRGGDYPYAGTRAGEGSRS